MIRIAHWWITIDLSKNWEVEKCTKVSQKVSFRSIVKRSKMADLKYGVQLFHACSCMTVFDVTTACNL